jgi:hypothetical protein
MKKVIATLAAGAMIVAGVGLTSLPASAAQAPPKTSAFDNALLNQLHDNVFQAVGVNKVVCEVPQAWVKGYTFSCAGLDTSAGLGGLATITVLGTQNGKYVWNTSWNPEQGANA